MKEKVTLKQVYHKERGQSLVELALTLLIILTLLAGTVDLGMAFFSYVALRDAAQEGALYGSINPDTDGIRDRVKSSSSTPIDFSAFPDEDIGVQIVGNACQGLTNGEPNGVQVTVTYDYILTMPFIGAILDTNKIPLTASVTDTILTPACP
ncbi:MAG: TadE/TadG family type IV pilus assembly protein [Chloroflexota bacterium]